MKIRIKQKSGFAYINQKSNEIQQKWEMADTKHIFQEINIRIISFYTRPINNSAEHMLQTPASINMQIYNDSFRKQTKE
jgi:hypothetical protein